MSEEARAQASWWVGEAINDEKTFQFGVTAGLNSGKTHGSYQWFHYRVRQNAGTRFSGDLWPTYQKIYDAAIPTYEKVLTDFGLKEYRDYKIIKTPFPKIVYLDMNPAHEVHFLSAERPDKIIAVEYSHTAEHEAGIINAEASRNLRSRTRDPKAKIRQVLREGAPQGVNNFADDFDSSTQEGWTELAKKDFYFKSKLAKRRFVVWTDDNPFRSEGYIDLLEDTYGHNPNLIRAYRYGEFCPLVEGAAYSNYLPQKHDLSTPRTADPYRQIEMCWDFNVNPLAWTAVQKQVFEELGERNFRWIAIDEANTGANQILDACVEFASKFPVSRFRDTEIRLFGDRTGHAGSHKIEGSDFELIEKALRELGYRNVSIMATRLVAPEKESVEAVQKLFLYNLLAVNPHCRLLKKSLLATTWKPGTRKLHKPAGETWTHPADGLKYWAWQETRHNYGEKQILGFNY